MNTRDRIVLAMSELLRRQGYAATGMKQVVAAADAPMGSIYHHFAGGKRDIAAASLRQSGRAYAEFVGMLLAPAHAELPATIESAFREAADTLTESGWINMCPVGTVAGEIADSEPELRMAAAEVMAGWVETGTELFAAYGLPEDRARRLILAMISALEGAFVLARTTHTRDPLDAAGQAMAAYAAHLLAAPVGADTASVGRTT